MKKFIYIAFIILFAACGGDDTPSNNAPTVPSLLYPTDNLLCSDNQLQLEWSTATDEDGDPITYHLQVATDPSFNNLAHSTSGNATSENLTFAKATAYYWRVKADDGQMDSDYSEVFHFYTEGNASENHLPFAPEVIQPTKGATIANGNTLLEWSASDVDTGDILRFDVYMGTSENSLGIIATNTQATSVSTNTTSNQTYYWKVVVKDDAGGETQGQIWSFTTE